MNWKKLFKRKTKTEKLQDKYDLLMKEGYRLSKINRTESDKKYFEANELLLEIELLEKAES
jgi:hypothetical protein